MTKNEPRESWQTGLIKDARGRSVRQLDPVIMHVMRRHDEIPPDPLAAIARDVGVGMTRANRVLFWSTVAGVVCLCIALAILLVRFNSGAIGVGKIARSLLPFCAIWLTPYGLLMGTRGVRFQRIRRIMLEHRRCPHCGYDLKGLPIDATDGATVCPECGCPQPPCGDGDCDGDGEPDRQRNRDGSCND